ncbi:hypothetical protein PAMP_023306 [Pampus punctatissimus]
MSEHLTRELVVLSGWDRKFYLLALIASPPLNVSTFACYAKTERKKKYTTPNNVCRQMRAEAITENTFGQIANMRSKVTVESEGSNITAIWLIATVFVTEASHWRARGGQPRPIPRRQLTSVFLPPTITQDSQRCSGRLEVSSAELNCDTKSPPDSCSGLKEEEQEEEVTEW